MNENEPKLEDKSAYEKPVLVTIDLALDEVMSFGCKSAGSAGLDEASCVVAGCLEPGS